MNEIICPHCGKSFELDNSGYADIMNQVRTKEFDKEVHKQLEMLEEDRRKEVELKLSEAKAEKDDEIKRRSDRKNLNSTIRYRRPLPKKTVR